MGGRRNGALGVAARGSPTGGLAKRRAGDEPELAGVLPVRVVLGRAQEQLGETVTVHVAGAHQAGSDVVIFVGGARHHGCVGEIRRSGEGAVEQGHSPNVGLGALVPSAGIVAPADGGASAWSPRPLRSVPPRPRRCPTVAEADRSRVLLRQNGTLVHVPARLHRRSTRRERFNADFQTASPGGALNWPVRVSSWRTKVAFCSGRT